MRNILSSQVSKISSTNHLYLDVRTKKEYSSGHIPKAINLDVNEIINGNLPNIEKGTALIVYCESGARSSIACQILDQSGFKTYNLVGGYIAWKVFTK